VKRFGKLLNVVMLLALGFGLTVAPRVAHAQSTDTDENVPELARDWSIRLGLYVYQSQTTRSVAGDVGISALAERRVWHGDNLDLFVGTGYNGFDRVYSVPVYLELVAHHNNIRFGGGAGYSFNKRLDGSASDGTYLNLLLGYQLTRGKNPSSVDLRYGFISGSNSELDGYSLTFGVQF